MTRSRFLAGWVAIATVATACGSADGDRSAVSGSPPADERGSDVDEPAPEPWRLLVSGEVDATEPRQVLVVDRDRWVEQWADLGFSGDPPDVDFDASIVIVRSESFGSGCEPRFVRLSIRADSRTVSHNFVGFEPGHECAADERWYAQAVEVRRAALEPGGYTLTGTGDGIPIP